VHDVYYACTIWWSYYLGPTCYIHMHGKEEKLARTFFLLHACWTLWLSFRKAREWLGIGKDKEGSKEKTAVRVGRARECSWASHLVCDDGRAQLVRTTIYGIREASETKAGKRVTS
jgi:hypothetical protein